MDGSYDSLRRKRDPFWKGRRNDWRDFENWCHGNDLPSLPSTPETIALYISDRASTRAVGTIPRRLTSITKARQATGHKESPSSTRHFVVGETVKGIRRVLGTKQKGKDPLLAEDIRKIVGSGPEGMLGLRDGALVLVGFAGPFRRSELTRSWSLTSSLIRMESSSISASQRRMRKVPDGRSEFPLP